MLFRLQLRSLVAFAAVVVFGRAVYAQQPVSRDSMPNDSTHRDSSSIIRRWLNFDHIGVALGPAVTVSRYGWMSHDEVSPGIAGGFFRGSGFGGHGRAGLVPAFKFDIFPRRLAVVDTVSGSSVSPATIRMRSVMAGLGWSQPLGHSVTAVVSGLAGETFNSLSSETSSARGAPFNVATSPASIANAMAWEVSGRVWHQLRPSTVLLMGMSYYRERPQLGFADGTRRASNFDEVRANIGIAFTIYHR